MSPRQTLELEPADTSRLANLCGQFDQHLKQIESRLGVEIFCRGNIFSFDGDKRQVRSATRLLKELYSMSESEILTPEMINLHLQESGMSEIADQVEIPDPDGEVTIITKRGTIRGRGPNQIGRAHV